MAHVDFQLPGLQRTQSGTSFARWIVPTAWAYSSKCNNRRIEHHFHGIWNLVLQDLIANLAPDIFLDPQYQIDSINNGPAGPDDSTATAAQKDAKEVTPDFSFIKAHVIPRPAHNALIDSHPFISWNDFFVKAFIVPCMAELKRIPTRRPLSYRSFVQNLQQSMDRAIDSLQSQAGNAFEMQSAKVMKIILITCVGKWWSWCIATCDKYITDTSVLSNDILGSLVSSGNVVDRGVPGSSNNQIIASPPNDASPTGPSGQPSRQQPARSAKKPDQGYRYDCNDEDLDKTDKLSYNPRGKGKARKGNHLVRYTDLRDPDYMEQVKLNVEDAKPLKNTWSKYILLGSPASNQRLFLIHRFLDTECTTMLDELVRSFSSYMA
jgi:hypothetical protein